MKRDKKGRFVKGHKIPEKWIEKIKIKNTGKKSNKKGRTWEELYGKEKTQKIRKKLKKSLKRKKAEQILYNKGRTYEELFGEEKAKLIKRKLRESHLEKPSYIRTELHKKIQGRIIRKLWENQEFAKKQIKKMLKGLMKRPTSYEQKICDLCLKYNLPFIYTGNGKFLVGFKNPDFKHEYLPILIEVYNNFHHPKDYEENKGNYFKVYGFKTIFINQKEITHKNWEQICLNKIKKEGGSGKIS